MPLAFDAAILSRIRSPAISRSNWAKESSILRVRRPIEVVVLNSCVTETKEASCASSTSTIFRPHYRSNHDDSAACPGDYVSVTLAWLRWGAHSDGPVPVRRLHQPGVNVAPHAASLAASLRHCSERSSHLVECQVTEICE